MSDLKTVVNNAKIKFSLNILLIQYCELVAQFTSPQNTEILVHYGLHMDFSIFTYKFSMESEIIRSEMKDDQDELQGKQSEFQTYSTKLGFASQ